MGGKIVNIGEQRFDRMIGKKGKYSAYWSNTSGNGLANSLIQKGVSGMSGNKRGQSTH